VNPRQMSGAAVSRLRSATDAARTFQLSMTPAQGDAFGLAIAEVYGRGTGPTTRVLTATAAQVGRVLDAVVLAVKASGHSAGRLAVQRDEPVFLDEAAGVRLSLTLFATQPVTKHDRIRALVAGVNAMSVEETYYWYAKCVGSSAGPARRALRVLLAADKTGT
jgi:hypothetical protein